MDLNEAKDELRRALTRHNSETARFPNDAARTYLHVQDAHHRLARIAAGCNAHMTALEARYAQMAPGLLLETV